MAATAKGKTKDKVKTGKKPNSKTPNRGMAKAPPSNGEVSGKSAGMIFACWNCGTANYIPFGWDFFICRRCGCANSV